MRCEGRDRGLRVISVAFVKRCERSGCDASWVVTDRTVDRPQPCPKCGHQDAETKAYQRELIRNRCRARALRERSRR